MDVNCWTVVHDNFGQELNSVIPRAMVTGIPRPVDVPQDRPELLPLAWGVSVGVLAQCPVGLGCWGHHHGCWRTGKAKAALLRTLLFAVVQ